MVNFKNFLFHFFVKYIMQLQYKNSKLKLELNLNQSGN